MLKIFLYTIIFSSLGNCTESSNKKIDDLNVKIRLNMSPPILVGCGGFRLAYGFIFKNEIDSSIVCIIRCPDQYGENFFEKGFSYTVKLSDYKADSLKSYVIDNPFEKYHIPTYLISEIKKVKSE